MHCRGYSNESNIIYFNNAIDTFFVSGYIGAGYMVRKSLRISEALYPLGNVVDFGIEIHLSNLHVINCSSNKNKK